MSAPKYIVDTNIFINIKDYTPIDVFPCVWNKMLEMAQSGVIISIENVKDELCKYNGEDDIKKWINRLPRTFFTECTQSDMSCYAELIDLVRSSDREYRKEAIDEFLRVADSFIIATAHSRNLDVLTNEVGDFKVKKRVKMPDANDLMNASHQSAVRCVSLVNFMRENNICFL